MYSVKKRFSTTEDNRRYKIFRKEGYQMDERLTQEQRELVEENLTKEKDSRKESKPFAVLL